MGLLGRWPEHDPAASARALRARKAGDELASDVQWPSLDDLAAEEPGGESPRRTCGDCSWCSDAQWGSWEAWAAAEARWSGRFERRDWHPNGHVRDGLVDRYQRLICWHPRVGKTAAAVAEALSAWGVGHVLEVGCGRQALGMLVTRALPRLRWTFSDVTAYSSPVRGCANAVLLESGEVAAAKSEAGALVLCWPLLASPTLRAFRGRFLVYIGEAASGCTADDEFFGELADGWDLLRVDRNPCPGRYDAVWLYRRRPPGRPTRGKKGARRRWKKK